MIEYNQYAYVFKVLSDETRLKIIDMLSCGEMCACRILDSFKITQPTLSYHMKMLTECRIVSAKREGAWMYYTLNDKTVDNIKNFFNLITSGKEDCICKK